MLLVMLSSVNHCTTRVEDQRLGKYMYFTSNILVLNNLIIK